MRATIVTASVVAQAKREVATVGWKPGGRVFAEERRKDRDDDRASRTPSWPSRTSPRRAAPAGPSPMRASTSLTLRTSSARPTPAAASRRRRSGSLAQEQVLLDERGQRRLDARRSAKPMTRARVGRQQLASVLQHHGAQDARAAPASAAARSPRTSCPARRAAAPASRAGCRASPAGHPRCGRRPRSRARAAARRREGCRRDRRWRRRARPRRGCRSCRIAPR